MRLRSVVEDDSFHVSAMLSILEEISCLAIFCHSLLNEEFIVEASSSPEELVGLHLDRLSLDAVKVERTSLGGVE